MFKYMWPFYYHQALKGYLVFIFCMKLGLKNTKNWRSLFFDKNIYTQNGVSETFLESKSALLNFSINQFIGFFWNCICDRHIRCFREILIMLKVGQIGHFWAQNHFLTLLQISFWSRFFWNCIWWQVLKKWVKWLFKFLEIVIIPKMEEMDQFWVQNETFRFFLCLFIRFFWNYTWYRH